VRLLVVLSGLAFVSLGLPDGLLGVAWPSMRATFARALDDLGVLLLALTAGSVVSSFASGQLLRRVSLGAVLAGSCALTSVALAGYAAAPRWWWLVPLAVVLGLGGGAIDAALNTYVATTHGPRAMNWLHASYGVGATLGPLVMTAVLQANLPWQRGYATVAGAQALLAAMFVATRRHWPRVAADGSPHRPAAARIAHTLRLPVARLGILAFVIYTGIEASFGAWTYTLLTIGRGIEPAVAGGIVSTFWGGLTAGRLVAAIVTGRFQARHVLEASIAGVLAGAFAVWTNVATMVTLAGVALAGLACGPIFPMLVSSTPARVGAAHTANAVGFQIAAGAVGLSVLPAIIGLAADALGVETIAALLLVLAAALALVYRLWDRSTEVDR
jgi:fucose permease